MNATSKPARIWMGTIPYSGQYDLHSRFDSNIAYVRGQREIGESTGYEHWQLVVYFCRSQRLSALKKKFGNNTHWEPTRSDAADEYVWKEETAVADSRFEWGRKPIRRSEAKDWDSIKDAAKRGELDVIPSDIFVRNYGALKRIMSDNLKPSAIDRKVYCFWGATGTGKSRRAWEEAGLEAYPKDPRSKFWDGYVGQEHVIIDEFRGGIDVSHLLRWLDRYPVIVEVKGSSTVLKAKTIYITSNKDPRDWYPDLDDETKAALLRRMMITYFPSLNAI